MPIDQGMDGMRTNPRISKYTPELRARLLGLLVARYYALLLYIEMKKERPS